MSLRIGINPLTWSNDDLPSLGAATPLEVCLSEGKQAGYEGFELGNKFPRDPAVLGPILQQHGLTLVSGWYSSRLLERDAHAEIDALRSHLHLLKSLNSSVLVYAEVSGCVHGAQDTPVYQRPVMNEAQWALFCERISQVGDYLHTQGIALAYHHHMGTVIETATEIDRLMAGTPDTVGLLLDTGHLTYAGGDPVRVLHKHHGRVRHVHCKDIRSAVLTDAKNRNLSFLDAVLNGVFAVPGDGSVDYPAVLDGLAQYGYDGWLVVEAEQDPAVAPSLLQARRGYEYLAQQLARIST